MRSLVAVAVGTALFAVLNPLAPFLLETTSRAESVRVGLLANGGSAAIGALVVVLLAGSWWGIPLGGLLCPVVGAVVYGVAAAVIDPGPSLSESLGVSSLNLFQYPIPATVGAAVAWGVLALLARLRGPRTTA